jgi:hypothetical protein
MRMIAAIFLLLTFSLTGAAYQGISVSPTGVNVSSQSPTTVYLTFGRVKDKRPAEASWCGELISAAPDIGFKCNPGTIYGNLPDRYNQSRLNGNAVYTDIMSVPASIARRAYQAAVRGEDSRFFYVRHFVSTRGERDEYVAVTCRLTGGGARVPLSLTNIKLAFEGIDTPVLFIKVGEKLPEIKAEITYTGSGRLKGRWEVVLPGQELPAMRDLLTEGTLPAEERGQQRNYSQLKRFNVFLPPTGKLLLPGPEIARLPNIVEGQYLIIVRIEASDEREGDSNLSAAGAGRGVIHSGGVSGVPLPVLRYYVGGSSTNHSPVTSKIITQLTPLDNTVIPQTKPIIFTWTEISEAACYHIEIEDSAKNSLLSAMLPPGVRNYRAPAWLKEKTKNGELRWRVLVLNKDGKLAGETSWQNFQLAKP